MKFITQTRTGAPSGNCTETCIACILEVDLDEVPPLWDAETGEDHTQQQWTRLYDWLRSMGYLWTWGNFGDREPTAHFHSIYPELSDDWIARLDWSGFHLIGGRNPDGLGHYVVARDGQMVWDPNPRQRGLAVANGIAILAPLTELPTDVLAWPAIWIGR